MSSQIHSAWQVLETNFPKSGTSVEKLLHLLEYAALAPSGHNSQPWRFQVFEDRIELYADRNRQLPIVDPQGREMTISCGAALFHLRVAMTYFGYADKTQLLPNPADPDHLATVQLGEPVTPTETQALLFHAILKRHTNRLRFSDNPIPEMVIHALQQAATQEGAWLEAVQEEEPRQALSQLIAKADREQLADSRYRAELSDWVRSDSEAYEDGIPGHSLGVPGLISYLGPFFIRTFDTGALVSARDRQLALGSALLLVLGTEGDTPLDWLKAGQALAHVLLLATAEGLSASFLNPPVEEPELRPQVNELTGKHGFSQMIMRMGYAGEVEPTPRRTVSELVIGETKS